MRNTSNDVSIDTVLEKQTKAYNQLLALQSWADHDLVVKTVLESAASSILDAILIMNERCKRGLDDYREEERRQSAAG